jgi:hypothetical protein
MPTSMTDVLFTGHSNVKFHMIRSLLTIIPLVAACQSVHAATPMPDELLGVWVRATDSCASYLRLNVTPNTIQFRKGQLKDEFPVEPCFSCEGGARYDGIVVWASPVGKGDMPFVAHFNHGERRGVALVDISFSGLQSKYPLGGVELKHCGT